MLQRRPGYALNAGQRHAPMKSKAPESNRRFGPIPDEIVEGSTSSAKLADQENTEDVGTPARSNQSKLFQKPSFQQ